MLCYHCRLQLLHGFGPLRHQWWSADSRAIACGGRWHCEAWHGPRGLQKGASAQTFGLSPAAKWKWLIQLKDMLCEKA